MAELVLTDYTDKTKAISALREALGLDLKTAKDLIDPLDWQDSVTVPVGDVRDSELRIIIRRIQDAGIEVQEKKISSFESDMNKPMHENKLNTTKDITMPSNMPREETMDMLLNAGKLVKKIEDNEIKRCELVSKEGAAMQEADAIRAFVPKNNKLLIGPIILGLGGCYLVVPIIIAIIWYLKSNKSYRERYLVEHKAENDKNADDFIEKNVTPIRSQISSIDSELDKLYSSGEVQAVKDFVGDENFVYGIIEDLYGLIKSNRADTIKEALNIYDASLHRQRMEEMQAAIQNASEMQAVEAAKQTAYQKDIARSAHQTATAAKINAYNTRQIDKNTRKFRGSKKY